MVIWNGINIHFYKSNLIRSAGSHQVDGHGSPDQNETRNDVTIPHALCFGKTLCAMSSVLDRADMDSENHSVVIRSNRITLFEINSIKTDNIDGYIINQENLLHEQQTDNGMKNNIDQMVRHWFQFTDCVVQSEGQNTQRTVRFMAFLLYLIW